MAHVAPGKHYRKGITILEMAQLIPDEESAKKLMETAIWPDGRHCPHCQSQDTYACKKQKMPYRCRRCRKRFSVKSGTAMQSSKLSLRKWIWAIYLELTSLKGVSSMKLHRDLEVRQATAWFMLQRVREGLIPSLPKGFTGPVEVDETYVGGKEVNKPVHKKLKAGSNSKFGCTLSLRE